eukprot:CAMPEP_0179976742 /NCGR_PEP_ID=MMETSP0983-20121128/39562_1 /TAXON_ID=483367 /ORGANISM="non described non described, Strain CCMP 2436" /LENGTH=651 /DNA_ID=CAMNT_0021893631 /DNA_START=5 /DNA_END=1958 /DNA_ORIENTATION=+
MICTTSSAAALQFDLAAISQAASRKGNFTLEFRSPLDIAKDTWSAHTTLPLTADDGMIMSPIPAPRRPPEPQPWWDWRAVGKGNPLVPSLALAGLGSKVGEGDDSISPSDSAGPLSERTQRRRKLSRYEGELSTVTPFLCLSGAATAEDRAALAEAGITHVLNCARMVCENPFESLLGGKDENGGEGEGGFAQLRYLSLWLLDRPSEDITAVFYDALTFIDSAREAGGKVLVHCHQGVSRSVSVAAAYLIWRNGFNFHETFSLLRAARPIASPNIGFTVALLNWEKRCVAARRAAAVREGELEDEGEEEGGGRASFPSHELFVVRPAEFSEAGDAPRARTAPAATLTKILEERAEGSGDGAEGLRWAARALERGAVTILTAPGAIFKWSGADLGGDVDALSAAADRFIEQLRSFEGAAGRLIALTASENPQSAEAREFADALGALADLEGDDEEEGEREEEEGDGKSVASSVRSARSSRASEFGEGADAETVAAAYALRTEESPKWLRIGANAQDYPQPYAPPLPPGKPAEPDSSKQSGGGVSDSAVDNSIKSNLNKSAEELAKVRASLLAEGKSGGQAASLSSARPGGLLAMLGAASAAASAQKAGGGGGGGGLPDTSWLKSLLPVVASGGGSSDSSLGGGGGDFLYGSN